MSNCSMEHKSDTFAGSTLKVELSNDTQSEMKNQTGIKFGYECNGNEPDNLKLDDSENETKHENFYVQSQLDFSIPPLWEKIHDETASSFDHETTFKKKEVNEDDILKHYVQDEIDLQNLEPAQDEIEISDDMADACKTVCKICHKDFPLTFMRYHTLKKHKVQITEYKQMYGNFEIIKMVYHKCHLCGKLVLLDSDHLGGHIKGAHKMKEKQYKKDFMVLSSPKLQATRRSKKVIKEEDNAEQNPSIEIVKTGIKRKREKGDCDGKIKSLKMYKETSPSPPSKKKQKSKTSNKIKATTVREEILKVLKPTEDLTNADIVMDMDMHGDVTTNCLIAATQQRSKKVIKEENDADQNPVFEIVKTGIKGKHEKLDCNGKSKSLKMPKETSPSPPLESKKKRKSKTYSKKVKATTVRKEILDVHKDEPTEEALDVNKDKPTGDLTSADIVMDMDEHEDITTDVPNRSNVSKGIIDTNEDVEKDITDNTEDVDKGIIDNIEEMTKDIPIKNNKATTNDYSEWISHTEQNPTIEIAKTAVKRKREKGDCNVKSKILKMPKETRPSPQLEPKKKLKCRTSKKIKAKIVREEILEVHKDKPTEEILDVSKDKPIEDLSNAEIVMDMDDDKNVATDIINSNNVSKGIKETNEDVAKHITDNTEYVKAMAVKIKEAAKDDYSQWISDCEYNGLYRNGGPRVKQGWKICFEESSINGLEVMVAKYMSPIGLIYTREQNGYQIPDLIY